MKSIIIPVVTAVLWISVVAVNAQDNSAGGTADLSGGSVVEEVKTETGSVTGDSGTTAETVTEEKAADPGTGSTLKVRQQEKKTSTSKNTAVKKETGKTPVEENKTVVQIEPYSGGLLQINEGNFKYRRIPDIKLADTQVAMASEQAVSVSAVSDEDQAGQGFLGMSKTASDVVVKGGIILFIFIIFILYKSRMKSPGGRKSGRKVLNSYRK